MELHHTLKGLRDLAGSVQVIWKIREGVDLINCEMLSICKLKMSKEIEDLLHSILSCPDQ